MPSCVRPSSRCQLLPPQGHLDSWERGQTVPYAATLCWTEAQNSGGGLLISSLPVASISTGSFIGLSLPSGAGPSPQLGEGNWTAVGFLSSIVMGQAMVIYAQWSPAHDPAGFSLSPSLSAK